MLSELHEKQSSDGNVWSSEMSISIEARNNSCGELVHKEYVFSYAPEWDKWTFSEYVEKRTPDTERVSDRNWRQTRHLMWHDVGEVSEIDVPPEVGDALSEATGGDVTIQVPSGTIDSTEYEEVYTE